MHSTFHRLICRLSNCQIHIGPQNKFHFLLFFPSKSENVMTAGPTHPIYLTRQYILFWKSNCQKDESVQIANIRKKEHFKSCYNFGTFYGILLLFQSLFYIL